jgi:hypothetical protein
MIVGSRMSNNYQMHSDATIIPIGVITSKNVYLIDPTQSYPSLPLPTYLLLTQPSQRGPARSKAWFLCCLPPNCRPELRVVTVWYVSWLLWGALYGYFHLSIFLYCLSIYLSISIYIYLSIYLINLSIYLFIYLLILLQVWKRSYSSRLPQIMNLTTSKTQQFC